MIYHILAIGDVVGEEGLAHLERSLRPLNFISIFKELQ